MATLDGFDPLRPINVLEWLPGGKVLILNKNKKPVTMQAAISPTGVMSVKHIEPVPVDQSEDANAQPTARHTPVRERWAQTDQGLTGQELT